MASGTKSYLGLARNTYFVYLALLDWVEKARCAVKTEWKFIFLWFYDFLFFILLCIIFYALNFVRIAK